MGLKLNGATSGSIELDVPAAIGSDLNITIPGAAGTLDRLERAGNILQVVHGSTSSSDTTNSENYSDNVTVSITPTRNNSKLLVMCEGNFNHAQASTTLDRVKLRLLQTHNSTDTVLWESTEALVSYQSDTNIHAQGIGSNFLTDGSDTWTGAVTLKFQFAVRTSGNNVSRNNNGRSTITVFEVSV
jgi:hypothetical protein